MGHAQFAFKKAEQQRQSSVTTLFTWRWLKQTAPHLAGNPDWGCPTLCVTPYAAAQQDWTNYRRTCKFTQDLAAHSHLHTHIQVHVLTCTRVVAKYFQRVRRLRSASRGRQRKYAFKWRRRLQGWSKCNEMLPDICTHACMATPKC